MRIFLFVIASRPALGPTHPPMQVLIPGVKRLGHEAEAKNERSYTSTPPVRPHGVVLN